MVTACMGEAMGCMEEECIMVVWEVKWVLMEWAWVVLMEIKILKIHLLQDFGFHFFGWAQFVGWPPIRSFRKNTMASNPPKNDDNSEVKLGSECLYVKWNRI